MESMFPETNGSMKCICCTCAAHRQCSPMKVHCSSMTSLTASRRLIPFRFKGGYGPTRLKADGITVYPVKKELYSIGITHAKTPFGHTVPTFDMERAACDLIRCRNDMEAQTFQDALKRYTKRTDKNLSNNRGATGYALRSALRQFFGIPSPCADWQISSAPPRRQPHQ